MEDYKEKYEQALERAKKFYNRELYAECNGSLVEYIFPELKESDDEKIRKNIISWLKNIEGQTIPINDYNSAIAWLEKQKCGPLSKGEEYTLARIIEYLEDNDCPSEWKDLLYNVYTLPYQKQTSAWSEEDERMINSIIKNLDEGDWFDIYQADWLKSLKERMKGE